MRKSLASLVLSTMLASSMATGYAQQRPQMIAEPFRAPAAIAQAHTKSKPVIKQAVKPTLDAQGCTSPLCKGSFGGTNVTVTISGEEVLNKDLYIPKGTKDCGRVERVDLPCLPDDDSKYTFKGPSLPLAERAKGYKMVFQPSRSMPKPLRDIMRSATPGVGEVTHREIMDLSTDGSLGDYLTINDDGSRVVKLKYDALKFDPDGKLCGSDYMLENGSTCPRIAPPKLPKVMPPTPIPSIIEATLPPYVPTGGLVLDKICVEGDKETFCTAPLSVNGEPKPAHKFIALSPGEYTVSEPPIDGFFPARFGKDGKQSGKVIIKDGEVTRLSIYNKRIPPTLELEKKVENKDGRIAKPDAFKLGITYPDGQKDLVAPGTTITQKPDGQPLAVGETYTLWEPTKRGYKLTTITGAPNGQITIARGKNKATFVNDDKKIWTADLTLKGGIMKWLSATQLPGVPNLCGGCDAPYFRQGFEGTSVGADARFATRKVEVTAEVDRTTVSGTPTSNGYSAGLTQFATGARWDTVGVGVKFAPKLFQLPLLKNADVKVAPFVMGTYKQGHLTTSGQGMVLDPLTYEKQIGGGLLFTNHEGFASQNYAEAHVTHKQLRVPVFLGSPTTPNPLTAALKGYGVGASFKVTPFGNVKLLDRLQLYGTGDKLMDAQGTYKGQAMKLVMPSWKDNLDWEAGASYRVWENKRGYGISFGGGYFDKQWMLGAPLGDFTNRMKGWQATLKFGKR